MIPGRFGPTFWAWAAIALGLILTVRSLLVTPVEVMTVGGGGVVARVNGRPISADRFRQAMAVLSAEDVGREWTPERTRRLLDRMIDEELLLQRAVELGLTFKDELTRRHLLRSVMEDIASRNEEMEPDEATLQSFYGEHREWFRRAGRVAVERVFVRAEAGLDAEGRRKAERAAAQWRAGASRGEVHQSWGDAPIMDIPGEPLPPEKLREYIGPTALRAVLQLSLGEIGGPVRSSGGYQVLRLVSREDTFVPPFEQVREAVRERYVEFQKTRAAERYVAELRDEARIETDLSGMED